MAKMWMQQGERMTGLGSRKARPEAWKIENLVKAGAAQENGTGHDLMTFRSNAMTPGSSSEDRGRGDD